MRGSKGGGGPGMGGFRGWGVMGGARGWMILRLWGFI